MGNPDEESQLLVPVEETVTAVRWYIVFVFGAFSFMQSLAWLTFSAVPVVSKSYYAIDDSTINMLLNMGPAAYLVVMPVVGWIQVQKNGLRKVVLLGNVLSVAGGIVRLIPSWLPEASRTGTLSLALLYTAQILNAAAGPCAMGPVSQLSCAWFRSGERTIATAAAGLATNFGPAIGFYFCPLVITEAYQLPYLLYGFAGMALVVAICCFVYFPSHPKVAPSAAARSQLAQELVPSAFLSGIKRCCTSAGCVLLILAGGVQAGGFAGWNGAVPDMLTSLSYSSRTAGLFAFTCSMGGIIGGLVLGKLADTVVRRRLKWLILGCFIASLVVFVWFTLMFPIMTHAPALTANYWSVLSSITLSGIFMGATTPLFYEFAAELSYPASEAISASVLTFMMNFGCGVILICGAYISTNAMNVVMLSIVVVCALLVLFIREEYLRSDMELEKRKESIQ